MGRNKKNFGEKHLRGINDKEKIPEGSIFTQNPFNLKINRRKHDIVNRHVKGEKGNRIIATERARQIREHTLFKEYNNKNKRNAFLDKRFGEKDTNLSLEEKMLQRFAAERRSLSRKKSIFNLNDDEFQLTHCGQLISGLDFSVESGFQLEDEEDLDENYVKAAHFEGFDSENKAPKSRREVMNEIIIKSKRAKYERQLERQEVDDQLSALDKRFEMIKNELVKSPAEPLISVNSDSYDSLVAFLKVDRQKKAKAADRAKSEEEIAREEADLLEKLEKERTNRMKAEVNSHQSAEALSGTSDEETSKKPRKLLAYVNGRMCVDGHLIEETEKKDIEALKEESHASLHCTRDLSLPYTFDVPADLSTWLTSVQCYAESEILTVVTRTIACHHQSLHPNNTDKLKTFFKVLFGYFGHLVKAGRFTLVDSLTPVICELSHKAGDMPVQVAQALLKRVNDYLNKRLSAKKRSSSTCLSATHLIYLRVVSLMFPTSDFRHCVTTPALLLIGRMLTWAPYASPSDIVKGLFLSDLQYQYVATAKRYCPEALNFLSAVLHRFNRANSDSPALSIMNFFSQTSPLIGDLRWFRLEEPTTFSGLQVRGALPLSYLCALPHATDDFKLTVLFSVVFLARRFCLLYSYIKSFDSLVSPLFCQLTLTTLLPLPSSLKELIDDTLNIIDEHVSKLLSSRAHMALQRHKAVPIKTYAPKIDMAYQLTESNKQKKNNRKLLQQFKREKKGAMRELRRDSAFISKQKWFETKEQDAERNKKVKTLMGQLAEQQAEKNKIEREKKKLKSKI